MARNLTLKSERLFSKCVWFRRWRHTHRYCINFIIILPADLSSCLKFKNKLAQYLWGCCHLLNHTHLFHLAWGAARAQLYFVGSFHGLMWYNTIDPDQILTIVGPWPSIQCIPHAWDIITPWDKRYHYSILHSVTLDHILYKNRLAATYNRSPCWWW